MTTCDDIHVQLGQMVDGRLPDPELQRTVRAHLESCAHCRGVLQDLEKLRRASATMGPVAPPDHVWLEVAGQVRLQQAQPVAARLTRPSRATIVQWGALAAALLLVTAAAYYLTDRPAPAPVVTTAAGGSNAQPPGSVEAVAEELSLAMQHYERAIAELEQLAKTDQDALDPAVRTTLTQNIQLIDQAIAESRGALTKDPGSEPARESLFGALRRKIGVLQTTVTLMNEMRKGNQSGAAEAAAALGKKG